MIGKEEFWDDIKNELSKTMQTISYDMWIEPLEPVCFVDGTFVLAAKTAISKKTIERSYLDQIREVASSLDSFVTDVEIIVKEQEGEYLKKQSISLPDRGLIVDEKHPKKEGRSNPFMEKYTFDTFVQGKSNEFALAAAKTVAENPGGKYNPLFIYSGVGLGKTHLLHAIGNFLFKNSPKTKVVYANSETMVNELIGVIRGSNNEDSNRFREKYRACDVLMIDDIQFLSGKNAMQESFFHIFNDLYQANKQIIITSDRAPKDLPTLEERLRTRFSWGLSVDIQPPDMETRVAILKMKAAHEKFMLSDEVAEFIAENATTNIRDMEGLLNKIIFFSSLANRVIDSKELAYDALRDFIDEKKETLDAETIISTVCRYFNITTTDIFSKKRTKNIVEPRMIAIYLITELLSMPLMSIGQLFGGRDHTTVIHARDKITEEIKTNPRIKIIVADLKNMLLNR